MNLLKRIHNALIPILILITGYSHALKESNFERLAKISKGKSGSDIHSLIKKLQRKRWSRLSKAKYFKKNFNTSKGIWQYEEGTKEGDGYEPMTFNQIASYKMLTPTKVTMDDLEASVRNYRNTVSENDQSSIERYESRQ